MNGEMATKLFFIRISRVRRGHSEQIPSVDMEVVSEEYDGEFPVTEATVTAFLEGKGLTPFDPLDPKPDTYKFLSEGAMELNIASLNSSSAKLPKE